MPPCPPTGKGTNGVQTMGCYSAVKGTRHPHLPQQDTLCSAKEADTEATCEMKWGTGGGAWG